MKQFLITIAGVFLGLALFFIGVPLLLVAYVAASTAPAPVVGRNVLVLDLREGISDQDPRDPFSLFTGKTLSVMGIEQTLRRAAADDHVGGLFVRLPEAGIAPASADELRGAFLRFRAAKKPILAYSQGLYASGMVTSTYELAAASGDVWMQPSSQFQVTGMARDDIFFKRFFDKHDIKPDFQQRNQYKTAINGYLYSDYTLAHRESELSWMGSVYDTALGFAATDRKRPEIAIKTSLEAGPYSAEDALAKGLIDRVGTLHAAGLAIRKLAGDDATLMKFADYEKSQTTDGSGSTVAVISLEGAIMTGSGGGAPNPFGGETTVRSDDITRAFRAAIDDDAVKAIVFRVSSPGGSDTASEQILDAVREARAAGKPVVVSMGTYGASGGYWISSQANEIVAQLSTLTGSIGVFGGTFAPIHNGHLRLALAARPGRRRRKIWRRHAGTESRRRLCRRQRVGLADDREPARRLFGRNGSHLRRLYPARQRRTSSRPRAGPGDRQRSSLDRSPGQGARPHRLSRRLL